uniref:PUM-HD domain-containing protein n=1 Tax=Globodera rostochiensis TaxID=31243 RepID=A0A914HUA8_GLORO
MINRFMRNFLNGLHIIREVQHQHVQAVHVACLHQCAQNVCPAPVLSCGARMASSSSNRPSNRSKLSGEYSNNSGSTLLDDYRNNRTANLQLNDLGKDAVAFALGPRGLRFIQRKLKHANPTETAQLVDALRGHVVTLSKNLYGSQVIQTALTSVDKASQIEIINEILAQVIPLSLHEYGSWVIRSVLELCTEQQKRPALELLHDNVHTLVTDQFGCHVIRHVIVHGRPEDRERIMHILKDDIMKYAQHKFAFNVILKCLICGTTDQIKALFDNVCGGSLKTLQNARQLMADEFGHYVIEKFFEYGTDDQKAQLVDALRGHVLTLALQIYGGPVIETVLNSVDEASQTEAKFYLNNYYIFEEIIEELTPRSCVIKCIKDQYGAYVMNTIIELIEPERLQFVVDAITTSPSNPVASLCLHEYGNWVIQCVLEHCTEQQKRPLLEQLHDNVHTLVTDQNGNFVIRHVIRRGRAEDRERIMRLLHENLFTLGTDPYGNQVIQYVIEHGLPEDRERIVRILNGNILKNAHHKGICSIIEKCLVFGTKKQRNALIDQVCADNGSGKPPLLEMMKHPFANDVVLKMMDFADSAHRDKMMCAIEEHIPALLERQQ